MYTQVFHDETIKAQGDSQQLNEVVDYYKRALSGALPTAQEIQEEMKDL
jgi:hypothetical protein